MSAKAIPVPIDCAQFLPGYQFADTYAITAPEELDAIRATERAIANTPGWITALMHLRNAVVRLAGLKTAPINQFPVLLSSPELVVLGFDDAHLDFRIAIQRDDNAQPPQLTLTTIVRTHNRLGRSYLRLIMPFHRRIARRMLEGLLN